MSAAGKTRWAGGLGAAALVVVLLLVIAPTPSDARIAGPACGDGVIVTKRPTHRAGKGRPPLVIGDSILGWKATAAFRNVGFRTNTQFCRTFADGIKELIAVKDRGRLPELTIMHVGTGGRLKMRQIKRALRIVGDERRLGLVTPREFKPEFGVAKRRIIHNAAERFTNVLLFDWDRISKGHDDWFHWDNLHPVGKGTTAMAIFFAMIAFDTGDPFAQSSA